MTDFGDLFSPLDIETEGLTAQGRRNIIRNLLQSPRWADVSGNEALRTFQDAGLGINRADFFNIYNEIVGSTGLPTRINNLGLNDTPFETHLWDAQFKLPERYRFSVRYSFQEKPGSDTIFDYVTVNSGSLLKVDDLFEFAKEVIGTSPEIAGREPMGFELTAGFIDRSKK